MMKIEPLRKSSQEVELDHLLAEEFSCDPGFGQRFLAACGLICEGFKVTSVIPEPSLGGQGFGDLLVEGEAQGARVALLIEDKVTAAPATRQASRYAAQAERLRHDGWATVWTILVGPSAYQGEREQYDAHISLERVADLIASYDTARLAYRRGVINRAVAKAKATGVQVPDPYLHELKKQYFEFVVGHCLANGFAREFPTLRDSYYDGDSWIDPIRHRDLPPNAKLRHRLWTSVSKPQGQVDLIVTQGDASDWERLLGSRPIGSVPSVYSKGKGTQISLTLPEMRQTVGFEPGIAVAAVEAMILLVGWYSRGKPADNSVTLAEKSSSENVGSRTIRT